MKILLAMTWVNLRSLPQRWGPALVIVVGVGLVAGMLVGMQGLRAGFERALQVTGSDERALLLPQGVVTELSSHIPLDAVALARDLAGIRRGADGGPRTSAEQLVTTQIVADEVEEESIVVLRGVEPMGLTLRPEARVVEGRWFEAGKRELAVGRGLASGYSQLTPGGSLHLQGAQWTIVGIFESRGDVHESEVWADAATVRDSFGGYGAASLLVELDGPGALEQLRTAAGADPRLQLAAHSEREFYGRQSQTFAENISAVSTVIVAFMALGAVFGALNSMYTAVVERQREMMTLRVIGFATPTVVSAVLIEALLLALVGGLAAVGLVYLLLDGNRVASGGWGTAHLAFAIAVTPELMLRGVAGAVAIGFVGGLLPALRVSRLSLADALRASS